MCLHASQLYSKRRLRSLEDIAARVSVLDNKSRFVMDVLDGKLTVGRASRCVQLLYSLLPAFHTPSVMATDAHRCDRLHQVVKRIMVQCGVV